MWWWELELMVNWNVYHDACASQILRNFIEMDLGYDKTAWELTKLSIDRKANGNGLKCYSMGRYSIFQSSHILNKTMYIILKMTINNYILSIKSEYWSWGISSLAQPYPTYTRPCVWSPNTAIIIKISNNDNNKIINFKMKYNWAIKHQ